MRDINLSLKTKSAVVKYLETVGSLRSLTRVSWQLNSVFFSKRRRAIINLLRVLICLEKNIATVPTVASTRDGRRGRARNGNHCRATCASSLGVSHVINPADNDDMFILFICMLGEELFLAAPHRSQSVWLLECSLSCPGSSVATVPRPLRTYQALPFNENLCILDAVRCITVILT